MYIKIRDTDIINIKDIQRIYFDKNKGLIQFSWEHDTVTIVAEDFEERHCFENMKRSILEQISWYKKSYYMGHKPEIIKVDLPE